MKGYDLVDRVLNFLKEAKVFYIATIDGNKPRVRPFGGISEFEGKLYIPTNNQKKVFKQMMENPNIEICGMVNGRWIRIEAEVVNDTRREARKAMLDAYGEALTRMYSLDDGIFEVLYLKNATATISSFAEKPIVINSDYNGKTNNSIDHRRIGWSGIGICKALRGKAL